MARVVIAENNSLYAELLAEYLQEVGHTIRVTSAEREIWAAILAEVPDVLLLDLGLPDVCAATLIPKLLERSPATRIFAMTGRSSIDAGNDAVRLGAHAHLVKPVKFMTLATHLQMLNEPALLD